mgnify:FL=1|jgi:hypothetical protein|tara:strand:- start:3866 stop:4288 length:423 start_codon:yes stop_codon:yes gene_type:complete
MNKELQMILELNECLLADGFDDAIVGISQCNINKAVYSSKKCIDILRERDGMSELEAVEFFHHNVVGSHMGDKTPIFMIFENDVIEKDDEEESFKWTDEMVKEFCKVYTIGTYNDDYSGCKTMNQKITRFKYLKGEEKNK